MTDPRLQNLITIADPSGRSRVTGSWRGSKVGVLHDILTGATQATETFLRNAHDIRGNRNFGPAETGLRLREAAGPSLKALNTAAIKLKAAKAALRDSVINLNPTKPYRDTGHWQPEFDLRLIDWFRALPVPEREAMRHQMEQSPMLHLDLAEAVMRVPRQLTGLDHNSHASIKLGLTKAFKRAEFDGIDVQLDQLAVAEETLRLGIEAVRETTGTLSDMAQHAPDALAFHSGPRETLAWLPPQ